MGKANSTGDLAHSNSVAYALVSEETITVEDAAAAVAADYCGAVVTFCGVVRNHDGGKDVAWLHYTKHPSADTVIAEVAERVSRQFPEVNLAVAHRVGDLGIGDIALACAVSAPHRGVAFEACSALVDTVKAEVPIWKKQGFSDGGTEWVASLG